MTERLGTDKPFFADGGRLFESSELGYVRPGESLTPGRSRLVVLVDSGGRRTVAEEWLASADELRPTPAATPAEPVYRPEPSIEVDALPVDNGRDQLFDFEFDDDEAQEEASTSRQPERRQRRRRGKRLGRVALSGACLTVMMGPYMLATSSDGWNTPVDFVRDVGDFGKGVNEVYGAGKDAAKFLGKIL